MKIKIDAEKLLECIGQVGDDLVLESETAAPQNIGSRNYRSGWLSMAAVFVLGTVITGLYFLLPANNESGLDFRNEAFLPPPAAMALPEAVTDAPAEAFGDMAWGDGIPAGEAAAEPEAAPPFASSAPSGPVSRDVQLFGAYHETGVPMLARWEITFPYMGSEQLQVISSAELRNRLAVPSSYWLAEWEERLPVYRRTPHYVDEWRLIPMDSPDADEILAQIEYFALREGFTVDNANAIIITEQPFYRCFCCDSYSGDEPFAVLPVEVSVRWGNVGITFSHFGGQQIIRHHMHDGEPRVGSWFMDAVLSSDSTAMLMLQTIPDDVHRVFMGNYAVITEEEAILRLVEGQYFNAVVASHPTREQIAHVELVYVTAQQRVFMPFFRFYTEMPPDFRRAGMEQGMQYFGIYYVAAVRDEFFLTPY
jgi:hypothetical protein